MTAAPAWSDTCATNPEPAAAPGPNWRDDPDGLDRLCEAGARQLHGPQFEVRDTENVTVIGELL